MQLFECHYFGFGKAAACGASHDDGVVNTLWAGMPFGGETLDGSGAPELDQGLAGDQRAVTELLLSGGV